MIIISWWHLCVEQKEYLVTENCNRDEMDFYLCHAEVNAAEDACYDVYMDVGVMFLRYVYKRAWRDTYIAQWIGGGGFVMEVVALDCEVACVF